jgi:hypothetical protein
MARDARRHPDHDTGAAAREMEKHRPAGQFTYDYLVVERLAWLVYGDYLSS